MPSLSRRPGYLYLALSTHTPSWLGKTLVYTLYYDTVTGSSVVMATEWKDGIALFSKAKAKYLLLRVLPYLNFRLRGLGAAFLAIKRMRATGQHATWR